MELLSPLLSKMVLKLYRFKKHLSDQVLICILVIINFAPLFMFHNFFKSFFSCLLSWGDDLTVRLFLVGSPQLEVMQS